jgi:hypothetical protein
MFDQFEQNLSWFFDYLEVVLKFFIKTNSNLVPDEFVEMARFITSAHGNPMLVDSEGKTYTKRATYKKNSSETEKTHWKCSKYQSLKCSARAIAEGNYIVKWVGKHNH